jgi:hypothetical protein
VVASKRRHGFSTIALLKIMHVLKIIPQASPTPSPKKKKKKNNNGTGNQLNMFRFH